MTPPLFSSLDEARAAYSAIHDEWWKLYRETNGGQKGTPDEIATFACVSEQTGRLKIAIVEEFGKTNPKYPNCETCKTNSVFGGPSHVGSSMCRSGRRPHCSCDLCF